METPQRPHARKPVLLVLSSTYPRWHGDHEPGFVHELSRRLTRTFDVHVLAPHALGAARSEVMDGVNVVRYRYAPESMQVLVHGGGVLTNLRRRPWLWLLVPAFLLAQCLHFVKMARRLKPDIVHAHWLLPQGFVAALGSTLRCPARVPIVMTSHGADLHGLRSGLMPYMRAFAARRASAVTVVSRSMLGKAENAGVPKDRISIAPMGVDLASRFVPDPDVLRVRGSILFVGRLVEKKGLRHLVEAMPLVVAKYPFARLKVVGSGPEKYSLKKLVASLGLDSAVEFAGPVQNERLSTLYRQAEVFVAPFVQARSGDEEGLGLVLVEAIGCACPVVVGDVDAVDDVIDPEDRVVVDATDHRQLALAILGVFDDPVDAAVRARRRRSRVARFDWSNVAATYEALLSHYAKQP